MARQYGTPIVLPSAPTSPLHAATKQYVDDAGAAAQAASQPLDADLTQIAGLGVTNDSVIQGKLGSWAKRTMAQLAADLSGLLQPLDADLTAISGMTHANDTVLQTKAGAWAARTLAQLVADLAGTSSTSLATGDRGLLTGGATDQVLAKSSATNYATAWVDPMRVGRVLFMGMMTTVPTSNFTVDVMTAITLQTEIVDTNNGHSPTINPSRYLPTVAGWYSARGTVVWGNNATSYRWAEIAKNGTRVPGSLGTELPPIANTATVHTAEVLVYMNGTTDYLELRAQTGVALKPDTDGSTYGPSLVVRLERAGVST